LYKVLGVEVLEAVSFGVEFLNFLAPNSSSTISGNSIITSEDKYAEEAETTHDTKKTSSSPVCHKGVCGRGGAESQIRQSEGRYWSQ
jgi:hypothetical protein